MAEPSPMPPGPPPPQPQQTPPKPAKSSSSPLLNKKNTPGSLGHVSEEVLFSSWVAGGPARGDPPPASHDLLVSSLWRNYDALLAQTRREAKRRARDGAAEPAGFGPALPEPSPGPPILALDMCLPTRLQTAPSCGFVALRIAAEHICREWLPSDRRISLLEKAQGLGLTEDGEMFDASALASFARQHYATQSTSDPTHTTQLVVEEIAMEGWNAATVGRVARSLARGGLALVPYDTDANHAPSCRSGQHAHWGLIKGFIWPLSTEMVSRLNLRELNWGEKYSAAIDDEGRAYEFRLFSPGFSGPESRAQALRLLDAMFDVLTKSPSSDLEWVERELERVVWVGQQPKSKLPSLWPFAALHHSNDNLLEYRYTDEEVDGGVRTGRTVDLKGLRGAVLLLGPPV